MRKTATYIIALLLLSGAAAAAVLTLSSSDAKSGEQQMIKTSIVRYEFREKVKTIEFKVKFIGEKRGDNFVFNKISYKIMTYDYLSGDIDDKSDFNLKDIRSGDTVYESPDTLKGYTWHSYKDKGRIPLGRPLHLVINVDTFRSDQKAEKAVVFTKKSIITF